MESRSASPGTDLHSDVSTTEIEDEDMLESRWLAHCVDNLPTDVVQDYSAARKPLASLCPPLPPRTPQIHRGPNHTSIHTTLRKAANVQYKLVFTYRESPRDYEQVLRKLTDILRGQWPVVKCKVFTNPTRSDRLAFVYIAEATIAEVHHIVDLIRDAFDHPMHIDLRTPEARGRILMRFSS